MVLLPTLLLLEAYTTFANVVYVSSSIGCNENEGWSSEKPLKTIAAALNKADTILLKSGDVFYEGSLRIDGKMLSRYGKGNNPTICGYKRVVESRWEKVRTNTWMLNLKENNYTGFITNGSSFSNNICAFHEYDRDLLHGRKVWKLSEMEEDWDFWQTETLKNAAPEEYDYVYLYLATDPNQLNLEMSVFDFALRADRSSVMGVNFIGFGFGISAGTQVTIRNSRVDAMGGRIIPEGNNYVCYGNGIEFWVSGEQDVIDCVVENCYVTRCYDCGITVQGSRGTTATPRNIMVRNNLIENCCQGWEDFLRNNKDVEFDNCFFENNIVLNSGNTTGFGYAKSRLKFCHLLGNNIDGPRRMIIKGNYFIGGNYYCSGSYQGKYQSNVWEGNKCYLTKSNFLLQDCWSAGNAIYIGNNINDESISNFRNSTGDNTTQFFVKNNSQIKRMINKFKKNYLRRHSY